MKNLASPPGLSPDYSSVKYADKLIMQIFGVCWYMHHLIHVLYNKNTSVNTPNSLEKAVLLRKILE
jgi:hypothetical protein